MKRVFFLLLSITLTSAAKAADVSVTLLWETDRVELKTEMERQLEGLLGAMNKASDDTKAKLELTGLKINQETKDRLGMLWEHFSVNTLDDEIVTRCIERKASGEVRDYSIRSVGVLLVPKAEYKGDSLEMLVVRFSPDGMISDICFEANDHQYEKVLLNTLSDDDFYNRATMVAYCEKLKMAYYAKDMSWIRSMFDNPFRYDNNLDYLKNLERAFKSSGAISITIENSEIMQSRTSRDYYGFSFDVKWQNNHYQDCHTFFMFFDFRNPIHPMVHYTAILPEGSPVMSVDDFPLK